MDVLKSDRFEYPSDGLVAGTVQRSVNNAHVSLLGDGIRIDNEFGEHLCECFINLRAERSDKSLGLGFLNIHHLDGPDVLDGLNVGKDRISRFRRNLAAVFTVDLVSVVLGRIVGCSDHDACKCLEVPYRVREHRYRAQLVGKP